VIKYHCQNLIINPSFELLIVIMNMDTNDKAQQNLLASLQNYYKELEQDLDKIQLIESQINGKSSD